MLTCKTINKSQIDCQKFPPPTAEKRLIESGFDIHERQKIYSLPFLVTKEIKLPIVQYKIIHKILYTNCILYKMKKVQDLHCPFCTNVDQTVGHLFVSCPISILSGRILLNGIILFLKRSLAFPRMKLFTEFSRIGLLVQP